MNEPDAGRLFKRGDDEMAEITVKAAVEELGRVTAFVEEQLECCGCPMKAAMQLGLAAEELFVNIAQYAYPQGGGTALIRLESFPGRVRITFIDQGIPFDPLAREDPDITAPAEERKIGGLGIYMAKKSLDGMRYEYRDGCNMLTAEKKF